MAKDEKIHHVYKDHEELDERFYNLIDIDYKIFLGNVKLATTPRQKQLLAAQTCHGHAMNGDVGFCMADDREAEIVHHRYINATVSDVIDGIIKSNPHYGPSVNVVQRERQELVDELKGWIDEVIPIIKKEKTNNKKYNPRRLVESEDSGADPLMGIELLRHTAIGSPVAVLQGLYLGAYMDSEYWREQMEDFFNTAHGIDINMHRGICTAANLEELANLGLTVSDLSHMAGDSDEDLAHRKIKRYTLAELKQAGAIYDFSKNKHIRRKGIRHKPPYAPVYVELNPGYGSSDDAAFNFASLMYGIEAGLGLILADAVDTIDKCLPYIKEKGEDELIGDHIRDRLGGEKGVEEYLEITQQDVLNLIFAAAIDSEHPGSWPSCSQRRFLEINNKGNYPLMNHIDHFKHISEGAPFPDKIRLGFKQVGSERFYHAFAEKMRLMLESDLLEERRMSHPKNFEYFLRK